MWSPQAEGCSLTEHTSFCGFSASQHHKNRPVAVSGIPVSGELAQVWHQAHLAGKSPSYASLKSYHPTSVHHRGIGLESGGTYLQNISFCRWTCQRRYLPRATACGPLGPEGHSLTENMPFGRFSPGLRHLNQLAAMAEILVFGGWAAIFANLNLLDFSTGSVLRPKGQATPHANFAAPRPSVAAE